MAAAAIRNALDLQARHLLTGPAGMNTPCLWQGPLLTSPNVQPPNSRNASGAMIAVSTAFKPMPIPEKTPAVWFT